MGEDEKDVSMCDTYGYLADSSGNDVLARDACCACGGGQDRQIDPPDAPPSSPTAAPTVSPTVTPTGAPTVTPTVTPTGAPTVTPTTTPSATPSSDDSSSAPMFGTNGFSLLFTCSVTWFVHFLFLDV